MGVNPQVNPDNIRINFPAPTEDSRKQNVKKAKEILEQCKTKIKNIRQDCKKMYEKLEGISEDVIHGFNDELDKITKKYNLEVESIFEHKQVELLKI
jgi:ribosome recycling factor